IYLFAAVAGKLLEQGALSAGQLPRGLHEDAYELVAACAATQIGDALPLQTQHAARLRSRRDLHLEFAFQGRHVDLRAERGMREADRDLTDDVVALTGEQRMLADADDDIEVTGRTAVSSCLTFAAQLQPRTIVHARGDLDVQRLGLLHHSGAAALPT